MKVLITGSDGFIGRNLRLHLRERKDVEVVAFTRADEPATLAGKLRDVDVVFHLAGVNRPQDPAEFVSGNTDLTVALCDAVRARLNNSGRAPAILYTSSTQAERDNPYGQSKRGAEEALAALARGHNVPVYLFRLPNVFGKWSRPDYNSVVATFCYRIARDIPVQINDPQAAMTLVHIDDVIGHFLACIDTPPPSTVGTPWSPEVTPQYSLKVGELAESLTAFKHSRDTLVTERVGTGLMRALYATYVSYLPVQSFDYQVARHGDPRGVFVEMLKTPDAGQVSFFTAHPGVTRGGHYHHAKTEKFLVIKGRAHYRFRHMDTGETHELTVSGEDARIVETVPGWTHDITNIGDDELVVMLWANEIFDRARPDTFACPL